MNTEELKDPFDDAIAITDRGLEFLNETAKWARFIAIVGFIGMGLMVILGIGMATFMGAMLNSPEVAAMPGMGMMSGGFMAFIYIVMAAIYFFPLMYLYRFGTKTKLAIQNEDEIGIEEGLENLKSHYKFFGIFLIVMLGLYALIFVFGIIGALFAGM